MDIYIVSSIYLPTFLANIQAIFQHTLSIILKQVPVIILFHLQIFLNVSLNEKDSLKTGISLSPLCSKYSLISSTIQLVFKFPQFVCFVIVSLNYVPYKAYTLQQVMSLDSLLIKCLSFLYFLAVYFLKKNQKKQKTTTK